MGLSDSPLRDRVVFIEGAPRSGTTMLVSYVAVHPRIAGTVSESHMFDRGIGALFDNHGQSGRFQAYLVNYVSHDELVDLGRDIADRLLLSMRAKVKPGADWVVEKTPAPREDTRLALSRKLECFPDACFLHIVRDGEAAARSLVRAPFNDYDLDQARERWRTSVEAIRDCLGEAGHYRELAYEEVVADPAGAMAGVFDWLGVGSGAETLEAVRTLSRERISSFGPASSGREPAPEPRRDGPGSTIRRQMRRTLRIRDPEPAPAARASVAQEVVVAMRAGNLERLEALTDPELEFELRSGAGERHASGDAARRAAVELGGVMFARQFMAESWTVGADGDFVSMIVSGTRGDGARLDGYVGLLVEAGRARRIHVITAGDPAGEKPSEWTPELS